MITDYLDEISEGLADYPDKQKQAIDDISGMIEDYYLERPEATLDDIYKQFGTPKVVIKRYAKSSPRNPKKLKYWLIGISIALALTFAVYIILELRDVHSSINGHGETIIEEIDDIPAAIHPGSIL